MRYKRLRKKEKTKTKMSKVIAIFLILKAVSNGIKLPQRGSKSKNEFIGHMLVEGVMLIIHMFFGVWMLLNLC